MAKITPSIMDMDDRTYADFRRKNPIDDHKKTRSYPLPAPYKQVVRGTLERDLQRIVNAELKKLRCWCLRLEGGGKIIGNTLIPSVMTGAPDNIFLLKGVFHACELKAPGGKLSTHQKIHLDQIIASGGKACVLVGGLDALYMFINGNEPVGYIEKIPVY